MADMDRNCKDEEEKGLLERQEDQPPRLSEDRGRHRSDHRSGRRSGRLRRGLRRGRDGDDHHRRDTATVGAEDGREIKIGFVSPQTGGIASFGVPDKYCMERAVEAIGDGIVCGDGKKHPVTIVIKDSQSDTGPGRGRDGRPHQQRPRSTWS